MMLFPSALSKVSAASLAGTILFGAGAFAQSNTVAGLNVKLGDLSGLVSQGRTGTFPTGVSGCAVSTTSCNIGSVDVPWLQAMQENHPMIAFMMCRETNGRFTQISDRSFVKHGFFALSNNQCTTCQHPSDGTFLGVGCSDTYGVTNNGDSFWLAPADEVDPWLGAWTAACSHFDKGEPAATGPTACDGVRSLTSAQVTALGPVAHRMKVADADLNVGGSNFYYYAQYVIRGEGEGNRGDNGGSRIFTPTWSTTLNKWNFSTTGAFLAGTILNRWSGATVTSGVNGVDDGRVFIGVKVTGPTNGKYHYEYAVHNRDNKRGVGSFSIPAANCATVSNVFFKDLDANVANDWTMSQTPTAITFNTTTNPIRWNEMFNFAFDSSAAPGFSATTLGEFDAGGGAPSLSITTSCPVSLPSAIYGTGTPGCNGAHDLSCGAGGPTIGNNNYVVNVSNGPASALGLGMIGSAQDAAGTDYFSVGILLHTDPFGAELYAVDVPTDGTGLGTTTIAIPNNPLFSGLHYYMCAVFAWTGVPCSPGPYGLSSSKGLDIAIQ